MIEIDSPGKKLLMMGNEAIARGAIEAGVDFCSGYPGTPSSEILEALSSVAEKLGFYAEWSTNEMVALESACGASFSGLRALCTMKSQGVNVCSDFIFTSNLSGSKGGFVLVVCDDPSALSSVNEEDTRNYARFADLPLFEPSSVQEAKEMTSAAFDLSEELGVLCVVRSVTRISHSRSGVVLGDIRRRERCAEFDVSKPFLTGVGAVSVDKHATLHRKLEKAREIFEKSKFNAYYGPESDFIIITSGSGWFYSREALEMTGLDVGILKLGTTWPLPERFVSDHLSHAKEVLFVEEVDPFIEENVKILCAELGYKIKFYGRRTKEFDPFGEMNVAKVIEALKKAGKTDYILRNEEYARKARKTVESLPARELAFCPGCPHRASFWAIKTALNLDGRNGFVAGDIGCYTLGMLPTGFYQSKTSHCMGAGIGLTSGFRFLNQPVIAVAGDSTFFHACIPGLINARYNHANVLYVILDNGATAMTGFQPHPGTGINAMGKEAPVIDIKKVCEGIGVEVRICDPFNIEESVKHVFEMLQSEGVKVLIFRRACALVEAKRGKKRKNVWVDQEKCIGDNCGCVRFCSRVFNCPGIIWDDVARKARIDEAVCSGCGLCADLCPGGAIVVEHEPENEVLPQN
ncbi:MAG: thiamine pyrophosphate-dependent enzyme [Candidatus Syntropharchaeia archaeon]